MEYPFVQWLSVLDVMKVGQLYFDSHRDFVVWHADCHLLNSGKHKQFQPWDSNFIMSIFMCVLHHGSVLCLHAFDNCLFFSPCFEMAKA